MPVTSHSSTTAWSAARNSVAPSGANGYTAITTAVSANGTPTMTVVRTEACRLTRKYAARNGSTSSAAKRA
jgi:hypothetical protein